MADVFRWVGQSGSWSTTTNWFDVTTNAAATMAPSLGDTVYFLPGTYEVDGGGKAAAAIVQTGAHVTFGSNHAAYVLDDVSLNGSSSLAMHGAMLTGSYMSIGTNATYDIRSGSATLTTGPHLIAPVNTYFEGLFIDSGGSLLLGGTNMGVGDLENANDGMGNAYDPARDIGGYPAQGTGSLFQPTSGSPIAHLSATSVDFGTLHVGDTKSFKLTVGDNQGDGSGYGMQGGFTTNGISDSQISATPATFTAYGGGGSVTENISFTAQRIGSVTGQSINVTTQFGLPNATATDFFDNMKSVPITANVVDYAVPAFTATGYTQPWSFISTLPSGDQMLFLGELNRNDPVNGVSIDALNAVTGPGDKLSGSIFDWSPDGSMHVGGTDAFNNLGSGQAAGLGTLSEDTSQPGWHWDILLMSPTDSNDSGYSGSLAPHLFYIVDYVSPTPF